MRKMAYASILAMLALLGACSNGTSRVVDVPATPILSRSLGWAVVESSYAQVYDSPGSSSIVLGYYRRGVIVPVEERRLERSKNDSVRWVRNEGATPGWIKESDIRLFDSEAKAQTASGNLAP